MKKEVKCRCCLGTGVRQDARRIGAELRKLRLRAGLKQSWVAHQLGMSRAQLCYLESGRRNWQLGQVENYRRVLDSGSGVG